MPFGQSDPPGPIGNPDGDEDSTPRTALLIALSRIARAGAWIAARQLRITGVGGGEESIFCPFVNHARDEEQTEEPVHIEHP